MTLEENIIRILDENRVEYSVHGHEPVYTNPAMAEALGADEAQTVKSLVLMTKEKEMAVLVLPGDKRVDWKKAAAGMGTRKVSFAKPEQVKEAVGCEVGCVPPFGQMTELPVYMDPELADKDTVYFNPGVHDKSLQIKASDLKRLCNPKFI
ncbi:MAG: YbaK/EbsC family protein [Desulfobacteraceae bacterium]